MPWPVCLPHNAGIITSLVTAASLIASNAAEVRNRLHHLIRRVKCDEAKPQCHRCIASKRPCDGYLPSFSTVTRRQLAGAAQLSSLGPIRGALSQSPQHHSRSSSPESISVFDLFRHCTAPSTAFFFPCDFWTGGLLQLAHAEPAVWHAVLALGTLHRRWDLDAQAVRHAFVRDALTRQAIESYGRAVSLARDLSDPPKILALCLALVAVANLLGNWDEAGLHITAGLRLLPQSGSSGLARSAGEVLSRQDLQAMTFSESTAPYPYREAAWLSQADRNLQRAESTKSYGDAVTALFALLRRTLLFDEALGVGTLKEDQQGPSAQELVLDVCRWEIKMGRFERSCPERGRWAIAARLYHTLLRLLLHATAFGPETRWDSCLGYFDRLVSCVELLVSSPRPETSQVSLELGLIVPLFLTARRCRHPHLRRRAVDILRRLRSQEGRWNSITATVVAEKIIAVEEQTAEFVRLDIPAVHPPSEVLLLAVPWEGWATGSIDLPSQVTWDGVLGVPEANRCHETLVRASLEKRRVNLSMIMCSGDGLGTYGDLREEVLFF